MSATRVVVLALVVAVGLASAKHHMGSTSSCPAASGSQRLYGNSTVSCTAGVACQKAWCTCLGATNHSSGLTCTGVPAATNCSHAGKCAAAFIKCANDAADPKNNCTGLTDLWMSILAINGGKLYNASMAYSSCRYRGCMMVNSTAGSNCSVNYDTLCPSPVVFRGTLLLKGNWTAILSNAAKREEMAVALEQDLSNTLGISGVFVNRIYTLGTSPLPPKRTRPPTRRQQRDDALVVEFEVPGVSNQNSEFAGKLDTVKKGGSAWLVKSQATYKSITGGEITFLGVSEGTGSSAFSQGALNSLLPPTPQPGGPTPPTPNPPSPPTPAPTQGAAVQSVLAAVVVAVLSALLF